MAAVLGLVAYALNLTQGIAATGASLAESAAAMTHARSSATGQGVSPPYTAARDEVDRLRLKLTDELQHLLFVLAGAAAGNLLLLVYAFNRLRPRRQAEHKPATAAGPVLEYASKRQASGPLEDMVKVLQSSSGYADAYGVAQTFAAGLFPECSGALYLAETADAPLERRASWGQAVASQASFDAADCWAARRAGPYLAASASDVPCRHLGQPLAAPSLCLPVIGQGRTLGTLLLQDLGHTGKLAELQPRAQAYAEQVGIALANMRQHEALHALSVRDALTGLFNKQYMESSLQREIASAARRSRPVGVILCDLNQFKRFVERYGHDAGDYALRQIAELIVNQIRATDIACRFGPDEIVMILPDAPVAGVVTRAKKLREAIYGLNLDHFGKRLEKISASFGIAVFPDHGNNANTLLQQAQGALTRAMEFGNDRVQVASGLN